MTPMPEKPFGYYEGEGINFSALNKVEKPVTLGVRQESAKSRVGEDADVRPGASAQLPDELTDADFLTPEAKTRRINFEAKKSQALFAEYVETKLAQGFAEELRTACMKLDGLVEEILSEKIIQSDYDYDGLELTSRAKDSEGKPLLSQGLVEGVRTMHDMNHSNYGISFELARISRRAAKDSSTSMAVEIQQYLQMCMDSMLITAQVLLDNIREKGSIKLDIDNDPRLVSIWQKMEPYLVDMLSEALPAMFAEAEKEQEKNELEQQEIDRTVAQIEHELLAERAINDPFFARMESQMKRYINRIRRHATN